MLNNLENNISFNGHTRWFKKEIFINRETLENIKKITNDETVGNLPPEIIKDIINISKTSKQKTKIIKNLMDTFTNIAKNLKKNNQNYTDNFSSYNIRSSETKLNTISSCVVSTPKEYKMKNIIEKYLNKSFVKHKLINKSEKIKVSPLDEGSFGKTFLIEFPQSTKYSPKVFKFFYNTELNEFCDTFAHGSTAENNIMIYVTKLFKNNKKPIFTQGYFGSINNGYMVSNYISQKNSFNCRLDATAINKIKKELKKYGLEYDDFRVGNVIDNKIVDYGGIKVKHKKYNN